MKIGLFFLLAMGLFGPGSLAISGGSEVKPKYSLPWMAAIFDGDNFICGGSLISDTWVLTSAACANYLLADLTVQLHRHQLDLNAVSDGAVIYNVAQVYPHPLYHPKYSDYDIALFKLQTPATGVPVLPLDFNNLLQPSLTMTAFGWGIPSDTELPTLLLAGVDLPVVDNASCHQVYPRSTSRMFCAGGLADGSGACDYDNGGPIVLDAATNNPVQIGIISTGKKCGAPEYPSLFTQVYSVKDWIQQITTGAVYCSSNPCQNGGTCTERPSTFFCNCAGTGFAGTTCTTPVCTDKICRSQLDAKITFGDDMPTITSTLNVQTQAPVDISKMLVHTKIRHPRCSDLVITVTSPKGTQVILSQNTANSADAFDGTSWQDNDSGQVTSVTEFVYVESEYASPLAPLYPLSDFTNESPNGEWKLTISDLENGIYGELWEWGLEFITDDICSPNPCLNGGSCVSFLNRFTCSCPVNWGGSLCELAPCTSTKCVSPANLNLEFGNYETFVSHTMVLINQASTVRQMKVWVSITHQYSGDIIIILQSPTGTGLVLTDFFGYDFADAFKDVSFMDGADVGVANYTFTLNNIAAGSMSLGPLDPLRNLTGEFANGFWTLHVFDNKGDDSGVLQQWSFEFDNADRCNPNPCQNNGACQNDFNKYSCVCPSGFTGALCETELGTNTPSAEPFNPTPNPTSAPPKSTNFTLLITAVTVVLGIVVFVALVVLLVVFIRRRRRFSPLRGGENVIELQ